jgi:hypothetical protein
VGEFFTPVAQSRKTDPRLSLGRFGFFASEKKGERVMGRRVVLALLLPALLFGIVGCGSSAPAEQTKTMKQMRPGMPQPRDGGGTKDKDTKEKDK